MSTSSFLSNNALKTSCKSRKALNQDLWLDLQRRKAPRAEHDLLGQDASQERMTVGQGQISPASASK